jgi:RNA polymerase sigma-70 factor (ECF subfamily)
VASGEGSFEQFVTDVEPDLRRALVATYGADRGREAVAEALAYGWEHWSRVQQLDNPVGYLYRVGQTRTRRRRTPIVFPEPPRDPQPWVEPGLPRALAMLTESQRLAVVLVDACEWTLREVAELSGVAVTTVQNHLERGRAKLHEALGVDDHA